MLRKLVMASEIYSVKSNGHPADLAEPKVVKEKIGKEIQPFLEGREVEVAWDIDPQIGEMVHSRLVEIILENLLENAIFFQADPAIRKPEIKVKMESLDSNVKITVFDNGLGIRQKSISRIFDMFSVASEKSNGYGLGLYLVKKATDKLKGSVKVHTKENEFTTFEVLLPVT